MLYYRLEIDMSILNIKYFKKKFQNKLINFKIKNYF